MKKSWLFDAAIGLALALFVAVAYLIPPLFPAFESLELKFFDRRSKLRQNVDPSSEIVLIAIDDASISQVGRWPWPRSRIAAMLDKLTAARPKVIGLDIVYSEAEQNQGLLEIRSLESQYKELVGSRKLVDRGGAFGSLFSSAEARMDSDSRLVASLKAASSVVLPMFFAQGGVLGAKPEPLPPVISSSTVSHEAAADMPMLDGTKAVYPLVPFAEAVAGVGHVNVEPDFDGVVRREAPVMKYANDYYPSYALQLIMAYLGMKPSEGRFIPGRAVKLGHFSIPLDENNRMLITFNGPDGTFRYYSFQDVMNDKVSMEVFKDRIVIIGLTATGVGTLYVTPVAHNFPSIEMVANTIENILHSKFLTRPPWAPKLEWGLIALIGLFIMFALPRLKAFWGFLVSLLLLILMVGAGAYLFVQGDWIKVAYPSSLLALGYLVIISKRFFVTEKGKELVEASAIETNKMLGLSFQGQGMLDMAFEKFRLCPLDDNMKDTLYNLALDFERKRQFSKAAAVLGHIAAKDPKYKDIGEKMAMLKQASEGAVFGGVGGAKKEGTVMITGGATKPTLGRYEIEKELGRGAMGIVYLGRDPKINRQVAIKTMVLDEGSDAASTKDIKERFFREAESAGTLNHPNIVRIFDAGDEQDIAYIAMELLEGHDLARFAAKDNLLPPEQAMEYVAIVADALDYAHAQGIVHRDIKPANIMLIKDGSVRVADFGIARITASSKTATGTVMGTPSYMSPEQVAGKKVDGRADLFSLSVVLFEFLTGEKPFKGGEGIGTLLFQIANDPHPDPLSINPKLPPCAAKIINKGLAKNPDERYPRGSIMASDLRACITAMKSGGAAEAPAPEVSAVITQPTQPLPEAEPVPAPPAEPAAPVVPQPVAVEETQTLPSIELPTRAGVQGSEPEVKTQPAAPDPDATVRLDPGSLDATLKMPGPEAPK